MAIHDLTPPNGGGERYRLPKPQIGPVTRAIAVMRWDIRQAQIVAEERAALRALRLRISAQFAADAALLEGIEA